MPSLKRISDLDTFLHQIKFYYLESVQVENYLGRRKKNVTIDDFFF